MTESNFATASARAAVNIPPSGWFGVGQRIETLGKDILVADFLRDQRREHLPRHAFGQLDANALLQRFTAFHHDTACRPIAQVVAFAQQIGVAPLDIRLCSLHARHDGRKCLRDVRLHPPTERMMFLGSRLVGSDRDWPGSQKTGKNRGAGVPKKWKGGDSR
jgi:hypothetical protein